MITKITPRETAERQKEVELLLLDVRTPAEFRAAHAVGAVNLPLDGVSAEKVESMANARPVFVICQSGGRSVKACAVLDGAIKRELYNVLGGTDAWLAAGLPVVRKGSHLALDRQVRIAAGLLILVGLLLGWKVHPGFNALSAFMGAGLVFAGVTDWCGMAILLAKMPWNK